MAAPSGSIILDQCPGLQGAKLQTRFPTCSLSHLFKRLLSICYGLCIAPDTREAWRMKANVSSLQDLLFGLGDGQQVTCRMRTQFSALCRAVRDGERAPRVGRVLVKHC